MIFPPHASVLSAFGTLVSPPRLDLVRSAVGILCELNWADADRIYDELTTEACGALVAAGCKAEEIVYSFGADLRYAGQQHEIAIALPGDPRETHDVNVITEVFETAYLAHYGVAPSHVDIEIVNWRLVSQGPAKEVITIGPSAGRMASPKGKRDVQLWPRTPVNVYDRQFLALGQTVEGPVLIEERETTIVIPPGWKATVDRLGCIVATRG